MSGARFTSALACICISAGVAGAGTDAAPADPAAIELALARRPEVYLVLQRDPQLLSVRARGMELESVALAAVRAVWQGSAPGPDKAFDLGSPQVWRVTEPPADDWRRVVAPDVLVPYTDEAERPEPLTAIAASPTPPPSRPDRYSVATDSGWRLAVAPAVEAVAPAGRWRQFLRGWRRIVGDPEPALPPTLVMVVTDPNDARRLVHLFHTGMAVVIGGEKAPVSGQQQR